MTERIPPREQPPSEDARDVNDPARLADEARALVDRHAAALRAIRAAVETEPPTVYRP